MVSLLLILVVCVIALYLPFVQDYLVPRVLDMVNSEELEIAVEHFRLKFPLDIEVRGLEVKQRGDTLLMAKEARVSVKLLPLIGGNVKAGEIGIKDVYFKSGAPDSASYMRVQVGQAILRNAEVGLSAQSVNVDDIELSGGNIRVALRNDSTPPTPPSGPTSWKIAGKKVALNDIDFEMTMVDAGDSIGARLDTFKLLSGAIDLGRHSVEVADVAIDGVTARYIIGGIAEGDAIGEGDVREDGCVHEDGGEVADAAQAEEPTEEAQGVDTEPWRISVGHVLLDNGDVLYAAAGVEPQPGLDMRYVDLGRLKLEVDSFYNCGAEMRVPIRKIEATERSGLQLAGEGLFAMDAEAIAAKGFSFNTLASAIELDAEYGLRSEDSPLRVRVNADIDPIDVKLAMPSMEETLAMMPQYRKIEVDVEAEGSLSELRISGTGIAMRNYFDVELSGILRDIGDMDRASGHIDIAGDFRDVNFLKPTLMDAKSGRTRQLPPLRLDGAIEMSGGTIGGDLQAMTADGEVALSGKWNSKAEGYGIKIDADKFPLGSFLPGLGIGRMTAKVEADGRGLDMMSRRTQMYAMVDAIDVEYRGHRLHDLTVVANIGEGNADVNVTSANRVVDGNLHVSGNLSGKTYEWNIAGDFRHIDMHALGLTDTVGSVMASMSGWAMVTPSSKEIDATLELHRLEAQMGAEQISLRDFNVGFTGNDTLTLATVENRDLKLNYESHTAPDSVAERMTMALGLIDEMATHHNIDVEALQRVLPEFSLDVESGRGNALYDYLKGKGTTVGHISLKASNDSIIRMSAAVDELTSGETQIDRIDFVAVQEGKVLNYELLIDNEPGTFDDFAHISGKGYIGGDRVMVALHQRNIDEATGYRIGGIVEMTDTTLQLKLDPVDPVIGYKAWTVNEDNYIRVNTQTYHVDANLLMQNNESRLRLYTEHDERQGDDHQESINVDISKIQITDWISLNPYAPPMKGELSAKMRLSTSPGVVNGSGNVVLADFMYAKRRVGTLDLGFDVTTNRSGTILATTAMKVDGQEVMTATGALNDTTQVEPFKLDFLLTRLPLKIANPFIEGAAKLDGYLSGEMDVTGSLLSPVFDGHLAFDSATAKVGMLGTTFRFSENEIPVDSNEIRFNKYSIYGVNDRPIEITGTVDMGSMDIDLGMQADNVQVVGNDKRRGSDVYGKAYISLDAEAKGDMRLINARANVSINEGTNVTYVVPVSSTQISSQEVDDMVHFVNFADTASVVVGDTLPPLGMLLNLTAMLKVEEGSVIGVDLSSSGQDRVQVKSNGTIDFTMNALGDTRTTGRLNITGGYVRYSPPLMSEKMFDFNEGSYVAFNGNIANPTLKVTAVDEVKANVTGEGQNSRLVNFDVILRVNGTVENLDVAFDLDTNEDLTVRNELQSMSPEQRANQAMNLLLYNMYTGPGTKGNANITGNPLYSFLSSQLNTWMANNVKGVDISFGIDQYEKTLDGSSSTATSYSYRVSKSFMDDRFKVVVGGNYATDADANENLSQNLINDISFEYLINKSGTMYVKLFRHTGYESILEGEVTQTGVGFVYKRKLRTLRNIFGKQAPRDISLHKEDAVHIAGEVLRMFKSQRVPEQPAQGAQSDRQPFKMEEDEKKVE